MAQCVRGWRRQQLAGLPTPWSPPADMESTPHSPASAPTKMIPLAELQAQATTLKCEALYGRGQTGYDTGQTWS